MAENNSDSNDINYEEFASSLQNSLTEQRRIVIDKDTKIVELEKKIVDLQKENQEKLIQYDNILSQAIAIQQRIDLILRQERMQYQEQSTDQYFKLLHAEYRINDLDTENNNLVEQVKSANSRLESETNKVLMINQAYSGVFEAFISNFVKLYSTLKLQTDFLESISTDHETKIERIFANFPELLKVVENHLTEGSKVKELENNLKIANSDLNEIKNLKTALLSENNELKQKLKELTEPTPVVESKPNV